MDRIARAEPLARGGTRPRPPRSSAHRCPCATRPPISARAMLPPPRKAILHAAAPLPCAAEDRGADAHHGRALRDRDLEVVGHAHRKRVEAEPARLQLFVKLRAPRDSARAARRARDRHQAAQPQARQRAIAFASAATSSSATPLLVASPRCSPGSDVERRQVGRPLLGQPACDFFTVDGLHPVEALGDERASCCFGAAR